MFKFVNSQYINTCVDIDAGISVNGVQEVVWNQTYIGVTYVI